MMLIGIFCGPVLAIGVVSSELAVETVPRQMVDFAWLLSACTVIAKAQKIILVHGEGPDRYSVTCKGLVGGCCDNNWCVPVSIGALVFLMDRRVGARVPRVGCSSAAWTRRLRTRPDTQAILHLQSCRNPSGH